MSSDVDHASRAEACTAGPNGSEHVAPAFRALGMPRRLAVMQLFVNVSGTLCGCEIADILELEDYQVSRDLSVLREAGLVESRGRTGTWIHYQATSTPSPAISQLLATVEQVPLGPTLQARLALRLEFRERAGCVLGVGDPEVLAALDRVDQVGGATAGTPKA